MYCSMFEYEYLWNIFRWSTEYVHLFIFGLEKHFKPVRNSMEFSCEKLEFIFIVT